jgi:hypothetical protein
MSTVLVEKLTDTQPFNKLPTFHGNLKFNAMFTKPHHGPYLEPVELRPHLPFYFFKIHCVLPSHLRPCFPSGPFPSDTPTKTSYAFLFFLIYATSPAHHILLDLVTLTVSCAEHRSGSSSLHSFLYESVKLCTNSTAYLLNCDTNCGKENCFSIRNSIRRCESY